VVKATRPASARPYLLFTIIGVSGRECLKQAGQDQFPFFDNHRDTK
jgi:hypothetical protein